ncbi:MAG: ABC transporter substrate-binding protein [Dictyoglomus sp.]|nr:ABC transporter substrate-binding protein [Dictyoglomus sp.]MCX7941759.1 ABC transporter substrate-binding protein [Dictyoglomaceae bacterium]MDW8189052.1 ABC transporter substrate-binding protein [Dictyoglomus sp.]
MWRILKSPRISLLLIVLTLFSIIIFPSSAQTLNVNPNGWLDQVVFIPEKDRAKALEMLIKGDIDIYFNEFGDPALFRRIKEDPNLTYGTSFGLYYELTFNPVGPTYKDGRFNPFSNKKIREAMNLIVDRKYIVDEIMGGLGEAKFVPINKGFPEYERYKDTITKLEELYKYNFEKGKNIITSEMKKMGAELRGGKWYYKGNPVVIKFLIRIEDARKIIGDYVSTQLEKLGFTVERMYRTSREASPLWVRGNPEDGQWDLYTGGWITTVLARDMSDNFQFFYLPDSPMSYSPLWRAYKPDKEFRDIANKLAQRNFKSLAERNLLMRKALELSLKDSVRIFLVDQKAAWARRKTIDTAVDFAGGNAARIWPYTLRIAGREGGNVKVGMLEVIIDPWNLIAGSNWMYDTVIYEATLGRNWIYHPYTGLPILLGIESAELTVNAEVPTFPNKGSEGWLKFKKVKTVSVPSDAWYGWDVKKQTMVTAGEAGVKESKVKVVINYGDVLGKKKYHDGTVQNLADYIVEFIIGFERASKDSKLYDESYVASFKSWREQFVAWKIVKENPLIIEYYTNYAELDAELTALWPTTSVLFPWHAHALGIRAEEEGKLAFSASKAQEKKVEWMNYIGGPSLAVLKDMLEKSEKDAYIPFKAFVGKYVSESLAKERYASLKKWFDRFGHLWVSNGPYYLEKPDITAHTVLLKNSKFLK